MNKTRVDDFDQAVCRGRHSDVDIACPHFVAGQDETGRGVADTLAQLETGVLEATTGEEQCNISEPGEAP